MTPDQQWALDRLTHNQQMAETNAGRLGVRLLRGHGFPDEVMCDAQDALALKIVLELLAVLRDGITFAQFEEDHLGVIRDTP